LYAISISGSAYELTTPVTMPHHELVRKIYAILAFALLGFAFERSKLGRARGVLAAGIALTLYSYAIELGQIVFAQSTETFAEHSFDVASGFAGGALGALVALLIVGPRAPARRAEAIAVAVVFAVLAWGFTLTYARLE
jgi:peptidoglycan/LPS O-acetylase OafA/YrhL